MSKQEQQNAKIKKLKIAIIVLTALTVMSAGGLAIRYFYFNFCKTTQGNVTLPNNSIGEEQTTPQASGSRELGAFQAENRRQPEAELLELYYSNPKDNRRFEVINMLPGDKETRNFCIKVYHDIDVEIFFKADVTEQTKSVGDVLQVKVIRPQTGEVLCNASFSDIDGKEFAELIRANDDGETTEFYQIEVSLDTSVGNDYQLAKLNAELGWYVKEKSDLSSPKTGDNVNLLMWIVLAVASLFLLIFLWKYKRKEQRNG